MHVAMKDIAQYLKCMLTVHFSTRNGVAKCHPQGWYHIVVSITSVNIHFLICQTSKHKEGSDDNTWLCSSQRICHKKNFKKWGLITPPTNDNTGYIVFENNSNFHLSFKKHAEILCNHKLVEL